MHGVQAKALIVITLVWLLLRCVSPAAATESSPETASASSPATIQSLLIDDCIKCHGEAKQRGRLRLDSRAAALIGGKSGPAIIPGDAQHSLLMHAVRYDDPDLQMPPDQPLSAEQVAGLASWIAAGASWGDDPATRPPATASNVSIAPASTDAALTRQPQDLSALHHPAGRRPPLIGRIHPLVIHFPICCLLLAVLAEFLVITGGPRWEPVVRFLVVCGTLGALVAVVTGTYFAPEGTLFHHEDHLLTRHEFVGWVTMILALTSSVLLFSGNHPRRRLIFRVVLLATAAIAGVTGHVGGAMVYGEHFLF